MAWAGRSETERDVTLVRETLEPNNTYSSSLTVLNTLIDDRSPLEPWPVRQDLGELHGDFPAQGWDRVRYMPLGSNGRRVGYNFRVRQVFRGSRRFF